MNFCKFLDSAYLILQVSGNLKILSHITIELIQFKFISAHTESLVDK